MLTFPERWCVAGGGLSMDDYEHLPHTTGKDKEWYGVVETALRREIKEEVNIEIGKLEYLLDLVFIRPDGIPVLVLSFYGPYLSGELKLDQEEHSEFAWVDSEEAKQYDLIGDTLLEIETVDKRLKEGK